MLGALLGWLLTWPADTAASLRGPETAVERLHRKGVHCLEVLERKECAIENFEAVLRERTDERELVTDAMVRLIALYDRSGETESLKEVMRKFWDVGMQRRSLGHVAYSARYFPGELDVLVNVDLERVLQAPIVRNIEYGAEYVFTCSEARRADIVLLWQWKRARRQASMSGRAPHEHIYEEWDEQREKEREREARRKRSRSKRDRQDKGPLFSVAACPIALALGDDSLLGWRMMTGMMSHQNFKRSMGVAQIPGLDAKVDEAVQAGRLREVGTDRWELVGFKYAGQSVHLAKLDLDELTVARADMIDSVIASRRKRRERMHRDIAKLVTQTPRDVGMFAVLTSDAVEGLGFADMRDSTAGFLQALLPKPKGLQVAGVFSEQFGLFTRMPTDNVVKGRMLVALARSLLEGRAEDDPASAQFLKNLDIAEAKDRRAVLFAYVMTYAQVEKMMMD